MLYVCMYIYIYIYILICIYIYIYIIYYQVRTHAQKYFIKLARSRKQSQSSGLPISSDAMSNPDREDMVQNICSAPTKYMCSAPTISSDAMSNHDREDMVHVFMFCTYKICVPCLHNMCSLPTKYMFCTYKLCVLCFICLRIRINIHISM